MNLDQCKLTKPEWDSIEVPVSPQEKEILKMIQKGYHDIDIRYNGTLSLLGFLKVKESDGMHSHIYTSYLSPVIESLNKEFMLDDELVSSISERTKSLLQKARKAKINKADSIRLANSAKTLETSKEAIFEFVLLSELRSVLSFIEDEKYHDALTPIYTINTLLSYNIYGFNTMLKTYLGDLWKILTAKVTPSAIVSRAADIFERNPLLLQFADQTLYKHQRKLFTVMKRPGKKLVLYTAPTGTGKTMSPIGLAEGKKVIFVCAARHVGIALAKSAISVGRKIAFAFGCETPADVKLHYAAATEFIKDWRTGGIRKVDNSVGNKVEIIIADVRSYVQAMYYMMAFTDDVNDIVMYWDEPTIALDYAEHPLHELISKTWRENVIPNVVLSSATLPNESSLRSFIDDAKHHGFDIYSVSSQDFKKTIPVLGEDNRVQMPHMIAGNTEELQASAKHCLTHNSIMRYIDVGEAARVIKLVKRQPALLLREDALAHKSLEFDRVFPTIESVTLNSIKTYYCDLLSNLSESGLKLIKDACFQKQCPKYESTRHITTSDAYTITDGPALYLTNNVEDVANRLLAEANISKEDMDEIMTSIVQNNSINEKVSKLQQQVEDKLKLDEVKEKKTDLTNRKLDAETREWLRSIENLQSMIRVVSLNDSFIPNKLKHLRKWNKEDAATFGKPFCSDIPEGVVEEIMLIPGIEDSWKILLMMGVGVFATGLNSAYAEIMKDLADTQQLYLIIASTDYIYGTNYQFCHGYIGDDLGNLTQEKCIQALGRVGRNKLQHNYSIRFGSNSLLRKLFFEDSDKPEAGNINKLFRLS